MGFSVTSALSGGLWGYLYPTMEGWHAFQGYLYPTKEGMGGL